MHNMETSMKWSALKFLLAGLALFASGTLAAANVTDIQRLQGTWIAESAVVDGEKSERWPTATMTFDGHKLTLRHKDRSDETHFFKLTQDWKPKQIDIIDRNDVISGIYAIDGDTLKFCFSKADKGGRPAQFTSSAANEWTYVILKRKKR